MVTSDNTLRNRLAEVLATCICTPHPYGDGPQIDCPMHGRADYQADTLLPLIREHTAAAVQAERERLATGFDDAGMTYPKDVARGLAIAALITRKIAEVDHD